MGSIVTALSALAARLDGIAGVTTVADVVPEADPPADDLPMIALKVGAPSSSGIMDRRTLIWPVDIYFFGRVRTHDIAADIEFVLPFYEAVIARLDSDLTLSHTLDDVITYPSPMGTEPGVIAWRKTDYVGFILNAQLSMFSDTAYA